MQEILVLMVIVLAVFYLPRVLGKRSVRQPVVRRPVLTGWQRLTILITIFWIAGAALLLKPWEHKIVLFLYAGLGPAVVFWGSIWVWSGYRKQRR
jgi:hypothetical protein